MRKGFISFCVRGRQLQSRDREAVIPTKKDFRLVSLSDDWFHADANPRGRCVAPACGTSSGRWPHRRGFRGRQHILTEQTELVPMQGEPIVDQRNLQAEWRTVLVTGPKK